MHFRIRIILSIRISSSSTVSSCSVSPPRRVVTPILAWQRLSLSVAMSSHVSAGPSVPPSLLTSLEESTALLNSHAQPAPASAESVTATIRSIHSLLRTSAPSIPFNASLEQQFASAFTALFQSLVSTQQYEQAVWLVVLLPADSTVSTLALLRTDSTRRLILTIAQSSSLALLPTFPSVLQADVKLTLQQQAANCDLPAPSGNTASSAAPSLPAPYSVLLSYLLSIQDYSAAASCCYQLAQRVAAECGDGVDALCVRIWALEAALNALSLCEDDALVGTDYDGVNVVSCHHIRQQLHTSLARMDLLSAASPPPAAALVSASPVALVPALLQADLFDTAVSLSASLVKSAERRQALTIVVSHLVNTHTATTSAALKSAEPLLPSALPAPFHVEDNRVLLPSADSWYASSAAYSSASSPALHVLRGLLRRYDDSTYYLRCHALDLILLSPLALAPPPWLLSPAASIDAAYHATSPAQPDKRSSGAVMAVLRCVLRRQRLDLAVDVAVEWLAHETAAVGGGKGLGEAVGVEWNVIEDLMRRLEQGRGVTGLDERVQALINGLHSRMSSALAA